MTIPRTRLLSSSACLCLQIALAGIAMLCLAGCHRLGGSDGPEVLPKKYPGAAVATSRATSVPPRTATGTPTR